ncbi:pentapeptide repeat-containing protein [Campylobacter lari]|nr:pentapeptide repeat-containing protein [Campylobacter lari]
MKDKIEGIVSYILKIPRGNVELSDNVVVIQGDNKERLKFNNLDIDMISIYENFYDKESTIDDFFKKYNFNFRYCSFEQICLQKFLNLQDFSFEYCKFNESFVFENCKFNELVFKNCYFYKNISFSFSEIQKKVSFSRCYLNETDFDLFDFQLLSFERCKFDSKVHFLSSTKEKKVSFSHCYLDEVDFFMLSLKSLSFMKCSFRKEAKFSLMKILKKASFSGCKFKDEVDFTDVELKNNGYGIFSECNFGKKVNFTNFTFYEDINGLFFHDEVAFDDVKFLKKIALSEDNFTQKDIKFEKCVFGEVDIEDDFLKSKNISFKSCEFNQEIAFKNKTIENLTFGTCIFNKGVYFVFCNFFDVKIYSCSFNHPASFYGSTFNMVPNFSQSTFKDSINLVNIKTNFNFKNLNTTIDNIDKPKYEAANDFRDSFRNFKSALIKDNNFLDASNFHKYELYCKEIELEEKELRVFSKEWIDKWQLVFYRKLCDHHTDLLKVFHNLLIIIMLFSVFSFVLDKFKQPSIENHAKYHIVQVDTNESYIFKEHNKTTYNIFGLNINKESGKLDESIKNNFVYILILLFIVLPILSFNIFTNLYIFVSFFYVIFNFLDFVALYTHIAIISLFVFFVLKFILLDDKQEIIRKIIIGISYIVCIFALLAKPSLMLPVFGSFLEKDSNTTYPLLLSLSVVYFILVALVIFSLQKTARKNSIVPS